MGETDLFLCNAAGPLGDPLDIQPETTAEVDEDPFALRLPPTLLADVDTELRAFLE
jgi:hypothetical protein